MTDTKTQMRMRKSLKERLNTVAEDSGYTAELLADLLLTDALNQIDDPLTPTEMLPHVRVIRERLGRKMEPLQALAVIDRYFASKGQPLLSELVDKLGTAAERHADASVEAKAKKKQAARQKHAA